jgi:hypothetical protein
MSTGAVVLIVIGVHVFGFAALLGIFLKAGQAYEESKLEMIERGVQRALDEREKRT